MHEPTIRDRLEAIEDVARDTRTPEAELRRRVIEQSVAAVLSLDKAPREVIKITYGPLMEHYGDHKIIRDPATPAEIKSWAKRKPKREVSPRG